ncbi:MAG: cytochrome b6-f complex iron-sulfur subunit [Chloroflexota bacterium]|jgi:cytochrome b6-f complex iron-sulfur subunit|nr:cytochrome b6-f complex iron-sulfur subunit [Chloroflexota bacterium]
MTHPTPYGEVHGPPIGEITRRTFMRRMLGVGVGILSLEFLGGTLAFLWPNLSEGLGALITVGTAEQINTAQPDWKNGLPYIYGPANLFIVNVPAAKARVEGNGEVASPVEDPGTDLDPALPVADRSVMAFWRKCPHLGCQIPQLCDQSQWFECLCHGSKYTVLGEKRDGPAPRGMSRFDMVFQDGAYVVDSRQVIDGPPPGTITFDDRPPTAMPHCSG